MDRFDLEAAIHDSANILNDIDLIREEIELNDQVDNLLLGLQHLYTLRFDKLVRVFEEIVHNRGFVDGAATMSFEGITDEYETREAGQRPYLP